MTGKQFLRGVSKRHQRTLLLYDRLDAQIKRAEKAEAEVKSLRRELAAANEAREKAEAGIDALASTLPKAKEDKP